MIRFFAILSVIGALATLSAWLAGNPGEVSLTWAGWRVESSMAFVTVAFVLLTMLITSLLLMLNAAIEAPRRWRRHRREGRYARGLRTTTQTLVALAQGDAATARKMLKQTRTHLHDVPLTWLLAAQAARLSHDDVALREALDRLLTFRDTRFLASRSLSDYFDRAENTAAALPYASDAHTMRPGDIAALRTLVSLHARLGRWQEALSAIRQSSRTLPRGERRRLEGVTYYLRAQALAKAGDVPLALGFAEEASERLPDFAPAAALTAQLMKSANQPKGAMHVLKRAWRHAPHPLLAEALKMLYADLPASDWFKATRALAAKTPGHYENRLLIAEAAISARQWDAARQALKAALGERETARTCLLMATLEEKGFHDLEAAARWRTRAANAEPEPLWNCTECGHRDAQWHIHCPGCHSFDSLHWHYAPRATLVAAA